MKGSKGRKIKAWKYLWMVKAQCSLCPHCAQAISEIHGQQLPAEAASLKWFKFLVTHSVETGQMTMMLMGFIKGVLLDPDLTRKLLSVSSGFFG